MEDIMRFQFAAPVILRDALRRRFIGVVGIASNIMRAIVEVVQGNPASSAMCTNATMCR